MRNSRKKFVRIFIAIRFVAGITSLCLHTAQAVEFVEGRGMIWNTAWIMKAIQTSPAQ